MRICAFLMSAAILAACSSEPVMLVEDAAVHSDVLAVPVVSDGNRGNRGAVVASAGPVSDAPTLAEQVADDPRASVTGEFLRWPSETDSLGAFWATDTLRHPLEGDTVLDLCEPNDFETFRQLNGVGHEGYIAQAFASADCASAAQGSEGGSTRFVFAGASGGQVFYPTRDPAEGLLARRAAARRRLTARTVPAGRMSGFYSPTSLYGLRMEDNPHHDPFIVGDSELAPYVIRYGVSGDPTGVTVLPQSLLLSDGILRGLVRNWSPTHFAYDVEVAYGDQAWHWPLSMQPGEVAPFEIADWGDSEPDIGVLDVRFVHSLQLDVTRALTSNRAPERFRGKSYEEMYERYDEVGFQRPELNLLQYIESPYVGTFEMNFDWTRFGPHSFEASHPSLRGLRARTDHTLRAYGAFYDEFGRITGIRRAILGRNYIVDGETFEIIQNPTESNVDIGSYLTMVDRVPDGSCENPGSFLTLPVYEEHEFGYFQDGDDTVRSGDVLIWIGGAHPPHGQTSAEEC